MGPGDSVQQKRRQTCLGLDRGKGVAVGSSWSATTCNSLPSGRPRVCSSAVGVGGRRTSSSRTRPAFNVPAGLRTRHRAGPSPEPPACEPAVYARKSHTAPSGRARCATGVALPRPRVPTAAGGWARPARESSAAPARGQPSPQPRLRWVLTPRRSVRPMPARHRPHPGSSRRSRDSRDSRDCRRSGRRRRQSGAHSADTGQHPDEHSVGWPMRSGEQKSRSCWPRISSSAQPAVLRKSSLAVSTRPSKSNSTACTRFSDSTSSTAWGLA